MQLSTSTLNNAFDLARENKLKNLANVLDILKKQIPSGKASKEDWLNWTENLRQTMVRERNIGHNFKLTEAEKICLNDYIDSNNLIVDCLNCQSYVSMAVREEIENTLLLPPGI